MLHRSVESTTNNGSDNQSQNLQLRAGKSAALLLIFECSSIESFKTHLKFYTAKSLKNDNF